MSRTRKTEWFDAESFWRELEPLFDGWSRLRKEWTLIRRGKARTWKFHHTIHSGRELRDRFEQAGFTDVKLSGSFADEEYGVNAQRLIAVGRRPQ